MALYGLSGLGQLLGIQVSAGFLHLAFTQIPVAQCSNNSVLVYIYKIAIAVQHPCVCILPSLCLNSQQHCLVSEFYLTLCLNSQQRPCVWILTDLVSELPSEALCLNSHQGPYVATLCPTWEFQLCLKSCNLASWTTKLQWYASSWFLTIWLYLPPFLPVWFPFNSV